MSNNIKIEIDNKNQVNQFLEENPKFSILNNL